MRDFVYRVVGRMRAEGRPLSRNRHFHTFQYPETRRALRIDQRLRSLEADLLHRKGTIRVEAQWLPNGEVEVTVRIPGIRSVRVSRLAPEELELLMMQDDVRAALAPALVK